MTFMNKALFLAAVLGCFSVSPLRALEISGVDVPAQKTVGGATLKLNGAGVRTVVLAVIPIKAYVAAFYAPAPLRAEKEVAASPGPLRFDFTFLQGVGQEQVTDAWNAQFKASASYTYAGLSKDQAAFVKMFGPLKKYGVETVVLQGEDTLVYDGGELKGKIAGKDFQKAFLSMWFGAKPVMPSLKSELLGN